MELQSHHHPLPAHIFQKSWITALQLTQPFQKIIPDIGSVIDQMFIVENIQGFD